MPLGISDLLPDSLESVVQLFFALTGAYVAAFWFGLVVWTFRDIQQRSRDAVVQVLATLLVLFTGVLGVVLYLILRPPDTLSGTYQRTLEEEAIIREIEANPSCPHCHHAIDSDYIRCPHCGNALKKQCEACDRTLEIHWEICPYCGTDRVESTGTTQLVAESEPTVPGEFRGAGTRPD